MFLPLRENSLHSDRQGFDNCNRILDGKGAIERKQFAA